MTRPLYEPSLPRTDRKLGFSADQLFRRPAPSVSTPVIYWLEATDTLTTSGAGLTAFDWTEVGPFNDGTYFDITGGGDPEILDLGIYLFHVVVGGFSLNPLVTTTCELDFNVTGGSQGQWSSKYVGAGGEGFASWGERVNDASDTIDANVQGQTELFAVTGWASTATFPVTVQVRADVLEDNSSTAATIAARLSIVRIGVGFE